MSRGYETLIWILQMAVRAVLDPDEYCLACQLEVQFDLRIGAPGQQAFRFYVSEIRFLSEYPLVYLEDMWKV